MLPATFEAEKVRFHTLNRATGNRIHPRYVDAKTVDDEVQVKGYEREDGEYVLLDDEELEAVALESTRTIDIDCFVARRHRSPSQSSRAADSSLPISGPAFARRCPALLGGPARW